MLQLHVRRYLIFFPARWSEICIAQLAKTSLKRSDVGQKNRGSLFQMIYAQFYLPHSSPPPPSTSWFSPSAGFVKCRCLYVSVRVRAEASWLEYVTFWKKVCQMMYFWLFFFFFFTVLISSTKQTLSAVDTFISFLHLLIKGPLTHMSLVASRGSSSPPLRAQREGWPTGLSDVIGRSS